MNHCSGFALCILLMLSSGCASQMSAVLDESQIEVEGSASFTNSESVNTLMAQGTTLFHMSPSFQLGPRVDLLRTSADGVDFMQFKAGAEARYNLSTEGDILPFFGGSLGFIRVSADDGITSGSETGFAWALNGGIRVPVTPGGFLVTKLEWQNYSINDIDTDGVSLTAGYAVRF
ncbi:MAG TPA: hypothetical protein EYQ08_01375 [Planctomycetes bacterium]|nr:hypothetical protein [Planctomycetota bacterium]